jgi:hypothetical protein
LPIVETDVENGLICERYFFKKELKNGKKNIKKASAKTKNIFQKACGEID